MSYSVITLSLNIGYYLSRLSGASNFTSFYNLIIWQGSQYESVTERSEYARVCLEYILGSGYARILNTVGFCSEYTRVKQFKIYHNMTEYVRIGREYT